MASTKKELEEQRIEIRQKNIQTQALADALQRAEIERQMREVVPEPPELPL